MPVNKVALLLRRQVRGDRPVEFEAPHPVAILRDEGMVSLLALTKPILLLFVKQFGGGAIR